MNPAVAVDASVAVKWIVLEPHTPQARALLADCVADRRPIIAPPHFSGEVANALHQRWRSTDPDKLLTETEADAALARFLDFRIELRSPPGLYVQAAAVARSARLSSIYDALYVVLAQLEGVELWTADARLVREIGSQAPWMRALATYPLSESTGSE